MPGDEPLELVYGIHPVTELLEARGREVEKVWVLQGRHGRMGRLLRRARELGVPIAHLGREALVRKVGRQAVHQGVAAQVAVRPYHSVEELCEQAATDPQAMLVLVDRVVDPRNLGAILRACAGAGVRGAILSTESTVGLTPAVAKVSAGTVERIPVAREPRPARRIGRLRDSGFRAVALDPLGGTPWDRQELTGRTIFVAGGEARGPSRGVIEACDARVRIPLAPRIDSLNVAVALGVLLFEAVRQRRANL